MRAIRVVSVAVVAMVCSGCGELLFLALAAHLTATQDHAARILGVKARRCPTHLGRLGGVD